MKKATKLRLYIGCSLTHAPEAFRHEVNELKILLRNEHDLYVYDFVGLENGTDEDVYKWDIEECIAKCDMFVAILDHPSTGLGWELATAISRGIPVVGLAHKDTLVARLITGAAKRKPNFAIYRYSNLRVDAPPLVLKQLNKSSQI